MWPCEIQKIIKEKTPKIAIKYYEFSSTFKLGNTFKMDPSKIELFYRNTEDHFQTKVKKVLSWLI